VKKLVVLKMISMSIGKAFWAKAGACLAAVLCLFSCVRVSDYTEAGVSRKLAESRASEISGLHYRLSFNIPADRSVPVDGEEVLRFTLNGKGKRSRKPFVLDFKGDSVSEVTIGGKAAAYRVANEHILLDRSLLAEGTNSIGIRFRSSDGPLNRNEGFMYTLLVPARAREVFPCFDQPDMKGRFRLTLKIPEGWVAMTNAPALADSTASFEESDPLPTYLFAFVAGEFHSYTENRDGFPITMFHRENDPYKVAQCGEIIDLYYRAIRWMENYTGVPYPFEKYDFAVLPNFQYGGMEHAGASFFNDGRMFLNADAGLKERMARFSLVAHEVTHIWFGDYVTMKWFDDVWTKEVFANFFAAEMLKEAFPEVDDGINFAQYAGKAYEVDRTRGTNAIRQNLANLDDAGLLYGNIIYDKAPFVMDMLYRRCGEEAFHKSIRQYLKAFPYGNATWDQLIGILDRNCRGGLKRWSRMWITRAGMPEIRFTSYSNVLNIKQNAAYPQTLALRVALASEDTSDITVRLDGRNKDVVFDSPVEAVVANPDARSYGCFLLDSASLGLALGPYIYGRPETERSSILITLNENVWRGNLDPARFARFLLRYMEREDDPILFSQAAGCLDKVYFTCLRDCGTAFAPKELEEELWKIMDSKRSPECRKSVFRLLEKDCFGDFTTRKLYGFFFNPAKAPVKLSESDLTQLAFELAVRGEERKLPEMNASVETLLDVQRKRISQPDRLRRFDFVSAAVSPDTLVRDSLFNTLLYRSGRPAEPWASAALSLLNHPLRDRYSVKYIVPALEHITDIQRTSDIFFPTDWVDALLSGHKSKEAAEAAWGYLDKKECSSKLRGKILQKIPSCGISKR
jgi:aminopeptidase N